MGFRKYSQNYENGKCPYGFEYVHGYMAQNGQWVDSYCRKLKKLRYTDQDKAEKRRRILQQKREQMIDRAYDQLDDHLHIEG